MNVREKLDQSLQRFEELEQQMSDPVVLSDSTKIANVMREHGGLLKLAAKYRSYKKMTEDIREWTAVASSEDEGEREMAAEELARLHNEREALWKELLDFTIGGEDANRTRCVMEIRAGTGGEEAALFARDLYEMYKHHADAKNWKLEVMDTSFSERGGFKEIIFGFRRGGRFSGAAI